MSQTSVSQYMTAGMAGQLYDTYGNNVSSYSAEAAVGFGVPVQLGTDKERQVKVLTTSAGQAALATGIALHTYAAEQSASGVVQYADKQTVSVLKDGRVWINTDDAVVAGTVANLKLSSGLFTDEAVAAGIEAFTQISVRFVTGTTAAGLAVVEIHQK